MSNLKNRVEGNNYLQEAYIVLSRLTIQPNMTDEDRESLSHAMSCIMEVAITYDIPIRIG